MRRHYRGALACLLVAGVPAFAADPPAGAAAVNPVEAARQAAVEAGLEVRDLKVGNGPVAVAPGKARVHYTGWIYEPTAKEGKGRQFDSSLDRSQPFSFDLGTGMVIRGWDLGVAGMRIGGQRRLVVPATLAYGVRGAGNGIIPPNATLVFEVQLLGFVAQ
jgi:FKBP-type peptidyl-prolyl cis-trans isomerase